VIEAIEFVIGLPEYRERILSRAPPVAQYTPAGISGVFFGYDFHVHDEGLGLIEINTNAGGAMVNALLAKAQRACCGAMGEMTSAAASGEQLEERIVHMLQSEWRKSGRHGTLAIIAIVDEHPQAQYLYPEFLLFQRLFQQAGIDAVICGPGELEWHHDALWFGDRRIDLVYNRLTDFTLDGSTCGSIRAAYLAGAVVVTPNPQAHALYADKRNLILLSNQTLLREWRVPDAMLRLLADHVPTTELVTPATADRLWANRRGLFFKPAAGFGGRATYRGDKLTKRVWQEILLGVYIAQAIVPPGYRAGGTTSEPASMKFDIRCYTYEGAVQWNAARVYQGQTTNFRSPGGGFAPVYVIPDDGATA
jgi:hypothetical protein